MSESIELLKSIDASLKQLVRLATVNAPKPVASDRDLDSQYGNPEVKLNPRDWTGEPCKGRRYSECPPEFLDLLADTLDYFAAKSEAAGETTESGKPVAPYKRRDAERARGWARRIRAGWQPTQARQAGWEDSEPQPEPAAGSDDGWDSEVPF